jgi:hypothetical protein
MIVSQLFCATTVRAMAIASLSLASPAALCTILNVQPTVLMDKAHAASLQVTVTNPTLHILTIVPKLIEHVKFWNFDCGMQFWDSR